MLRRVLSFYFITENKSFTFVFDSVCWSTAYRLSGHEASRLKTQVAHLETGLFAFFFFTVNKRERIDSALNSDANSI